MHLFILSTQHPIFYCIIAFVLQEELKQDLKQKKIAWNELGAKVNES